ncbi:MAG TPA: type II toxin-antitoxin system CcdA family antitoxin [Acidimicrobiales bacterium]|nr:type II toxin-antitoxin system CcdA family antitoxin [Acidimicrobiales bacterium]
MSRVNIYLPDDLAAAAKEAGVNVSQIAQEALRNELNGNQTTQWVTRVRNLAPTGITHEQVTGALHSARDEMGTRIA